MRYNSIDMFDKIFSHLTKPIAICETGYAADSITVYGGTIVLNGTPQKQNQYLTLMLNKAEENDLRFVVNFVLRDYDALWQAMVLQMISTKSGRIHWII
ncbi:MAG: hypothetical protein IPM14_18095 [bacterium]|nr:hypothetical protein [bacterium]